MEHQHAGSLVEQHPSGQQDVCEKVLSAFGNLLAQECVLVGRM